MSNNRNRRKSGSKASDLARRHDPFTFIHNGKVYKLPSSKPAVESMKSGALIDAVMDESEGGQLKLAITTLKACDPDPDAWAALRDMNIPDFANTIQRWFKAGGVEPGKFGSSSD
jgi:hypothetical protein